MRFILLPFLAFSLIIPAAEAQSVIEDLPSAVGGSDSEDEAPPAKEAAAPLSPEAYTVTDVNADVTADTSAHARDQALMQAERTAYAQLCARLNQSECAAKMSDDAIGALVQSFEVQSEHLSAVRYIGVFTISFKPAAVQKKLGGAGEDAKATGPVSHLTIAVQTDTLASWAQIKHRIAQAPPVSRIDVLDLGRGLSHIDLSYSGSVPDLQQALTGQGLVLRQNGIGVFELYDGSMVPR